MEVLIIVISVLLLFLGLLGSFVPVIPGPPVSFIALLVLHFFTDLNVSTNHLIYFGVSAGIITFLDYWVQIYSVKIFGGGKAAKIGVFIGIIVGIITPIPFGFIIGPFIGAFIGALYESNSDVLKAFKIAFGALIGFLGGTVLKFIYSIYVVYYLIEPFWDSFSEWLDGAFSWI
tara:strand:+ start:388 stop:909 length:522 start_codon:yes stop_codon:yes gene_type:complete